MGMNLRPSYPSRLSQRMSSRTSMICCRTEPRTPDQSAAWVVFSSFMTDIIICLITSYRNRTSLPTLPLWTQGTFLNSLASGYPLRMAAARNGSATARSAERAASFTLSKLAGSGNASSATSVVGRYKSLPRSSRSPSLLRRSRSLRQLSRGRVNRRRPWYARFGRQRSRWQRYMRDEVRVHLARRLPQETIAKFALSESIEGLVYQLVHDASSRRSSASKRACWRPATATRTCGSAGRAASSSPLKTRPGRSRTCSIDFPTRQPNASAVTDTAHSLVGRVDCSTRQRRVTAMS